VVSRSTWLFDTAMKKAVETVLAKYLAANEAGASLPPRSY
jgi:hypothetical protein